MSAPDIHAVIEKATAQLAQLKSAAAQIAASTGRATSADGLVTAEVSITGALVGLSLDESVTRLSPEEIGRLIAETAAEAARQGLAHREQVLGALGTNLSAS